MTGHATDRPWLEPGLPARDRVEALLAEMTLPELVGQLHQSANVDPTDPADAALLATGAIGSTLLASGALAGAERDEGVDRARVDALQRAATSTSRLGLPLLVARDVIHGHRTIAPIPLGLAASADEDLVADVARRAALEAAADGITWTFAPMIDLVEDARWGRVAESFGESPLLTSRLGAASIRGFQESGRLAACAKHFVGYGLSRGGREYASVDVGELTLRNHHLRPFRAAVEAGVHTVMAAFSDVDGIPMHSHRRLLREVLKEEWGFDGVVVADWNGIGELVEHGVAADLRDAARLAIEAGVDVDMVSGAYHAHLAELVERGDVPRDLVLDAARRVLLLKVRLGLLDPGCPALPGVTPVEGSRALGIDRDLAARAAAASLVVLKDDDALPLAPPAAGTTLLLTGAFAHETTGLLGTWVLDGNGEEVVPIGAALRSGLAGLAGQDSAGSLVVDTGGFPDVTLRHAREAGTTIALVGEHPWRSGEDAAVSDVGLPHGQLDLLRAIAGVAKRLVVVVLTGRPLALGEVLAVADAVVLAFHPGTEGGAVIADVLLGRASAVGHLPMSLPRSAGHVPISHAERPSGRPLPASATGRGRYVDSPATPLLPFGAGATGLSYGPLRLVDGPAVAVDGGTARVALTVTNSGDVDVREPVLLMMRDEVAEVTRPLRELADLAVVDVPAGTSREVAFTLPSAAFGYHGRDLRHRVDAGRVVLTAGWGRPDESSVGVDLV